MSLLSTLCSRRVQALNKSRKPAQAKVETNAFTQPGCAEAALVLVTYTFASSEYNHLINRRRHF